MIRIPNPVSDPKIFMRVFRDVYGILRERDEFGLDDISRAMIDTNNVTSQGSIGEEALRRSTRKNRSLDPIYNQSKMYAELFRTLGWIQSTTSKLKFAFTLLGLHITSADNPEALLHECLLGIAYPNEVLDVRSNQTIRVIGSILLVMDELGSITRDEMMAGPMSLDDDSNPTAFQAMVQRLIECRQKPQKLDAWLNEIAARRKIKRGSTMTNYTRFPIGVIRGTGWSDFTHNRPLAITDKGRATAAHLRQAPDIRLSQFNALVNAVKPSFIRWTFYAMLKRAGFNVEPVHNVIDTSLKKLITYNAPHSEYIYFSPFQQLSNETIAMWTPELVSTISNAGKQASGLLVEAMAKVPGSVKQQRTTIVIESIGNATRITKDTAELVSKIGKMLTETGSVDAATDALMALYNQANREVFYPLVTNLFCILGFNCQMSRGGQNYERADAIILDSNKSIPIEIKSPGEESEISVKGVRQALENKVVLLSRCSYPTDNETTSLVVGFNPPNKRSEVHELIENIRNAFNMRVGVIDFHSLLFMAVYSIHSGKQLRLSDIFKLQGAIRVKRFTSTS